MYKAIVVPPTFRNARRIAFISLYPVNARLRNTATERVTSAAGSPYVLQEVRSLKHAEDSYSQGIHL